MKNPEERSFILPSQKAEAALRIIRGESTPESIALELGVPVREAECWSRIVSESTPELFCSTWGEKRIRPYILYVEHLSMIQKQLEHLGKKVDKISEAITEETVALSE